MTEIADNIARIRDRIAAAAGRSQRTPESVSLVAVSKKVSPGRIVEAYNAGMRIFGESYLQEALTKIGHAPLDLTDIEWHFIGRLQSNKVRDVEAHFALIQSVDSRKLAEGIGRRAVNAGRIARILLEVKLDSVGTKIGIEPEKALQEALGISELPGIRLEGLMGIAPYVTAADAGAGAEASRPVFRELAKLFCRLPETCRQTLSMGMTGDFEVAIEEGATMVRIGTGLFGNR
jgi:pyridoxal phosphate enzyme (YggS family)